MNSLTKAWQCCTCGTSHSVAQQKKRVFIRSLSLVWSRAGCRALRLALMPVVFIPGYGRGMHCLPSKGPISGLGPDRDQCVSKPLWGLYLDIGPDRDQVTKSALWKATTGYDPVWSEFEMMATIATEKVPIFSKPVSHRLISLSLSYFVVCPFKDFLWFGNWLPWPPHLCCQVLRSRLRPRINFGAFLGHATQVFNICRVASGRPWYSLQLSRSDDYLFLTVGLVGGACNLMWSR